MLCVVFQAFTPKETRPFIDRFMLSCVTRSILQSRRRYLLSSVAGSSLISASVVAVAPAVAAIAIVAPVAPISSISSLVSSSISASSVDLPLILPLLLSIDSLLVRSSPLSFSVSDSASASASVPLSLPVRRQETVASL